jgi:hypothetical protein
MAYRCEYNLNGDKRRLILTQGKEEPFDHVALRLAAFALFWTSEPKMELSPSHPALDSVEFRPDFLALNDAGEIVLWGECGNTSLNKLDKLTRRFPSARIVALRASEPEGKRMRADVDDAVDRNGRIEILAFRAEDFILWRNAVEEKIELFGESNERSFNLVINHTPLACDLAAF